MAEVNLPHTFHRPLCRDCADHDGICPIDGTPCIPYATKLRQFAMLRRKFPGKRPVVDGDFVHSCEAGARALDERDELLRLAKEATNGWACSAKRKIEHDEIARLHREIARLEGK